MKKAITILTICLLVFTETQNAQAQTKEETIVWLKDKFTNSTKFINYDESSMVLSNFSFKKMDECSIVFTYTLTGIISKKDYYSEQTLPTIDVNINDNGRLSYSYKAIIDQDMKGNNRFIDVSGFEIIESEPDLRNRVLKALKHLSNFCTEKKQTF